jgi:hypothetical protein
LGGSVGAYIGILKWKEKGRNYKIT